MWWTVQLVSWITIYPDIWPIILPIREVSMSSLSKNCVQLSQFMWIHRSSLLLLEWPMHAWTNWAPDSNPVGKVTNKWMTHHAEDKQQQKECVLFFLFVLLLAITTFSPPHLLFALLNSSRRCFGQSNLATPICLLEEHIWVCSGQVVATQHFVTEFYTTSCLSHYHKKEKQKKRNRLKWYDMKNVSSWLTLWRMPCKVSWKGNIQF